MSRIGRLPIEVPAGVDVKIDGSYVHVKGPKGEMEFTFSPAINIKKEDGTIVIERPSDQPMHRALHGTTRSVINNMVVGVSKGFERVLEIVGVGYRAELEGKNLIINVGFSHPVVVEPPEGISFDVDMKVRQIRVSGYDKQVVGQGQGRAAVRVVRGAVEQVGVGNQQHRDVVGLGRRGRLEGAAKDLGLENVVIWAGRRGDVPDLLQAMDVWVMSSLREGLPVALLEAKAWEAFLKAVDRTDLIDPNETFEHPLISTHPETERSGWDTARPVASIAPASARRTRMLRPSPVSV